MIKKIPIALFQICSVILFIIMLFSAGINRYLRTMDSFTLGMLQFFILGLLNFIVFIGYFKISEDDEIKYLKYSSIIISFTLLLYIVSSALMSQFLGIEEFTANPILNIPNFILGVVTIYFGAILFRIKKLNGRITIPFAVISIITGLLYIINFIIPLVYFARWFFYGAACVYLFFRKSEPNMLKHK
jgi:hypothetical protein